MLRNLTELIRTLRAWRAQLAVLMRIAGHHLPAVRDFTGETELDAIDALTVHKHEQGGVVRIRECHVRAIELVDGKRRRKSRAQVPLQSDFVIRELLGLERAVRCGQRSELFTG